MIEGVEAPFVVSRPRCDWHQCENTAVIERETTYKVKGESVYRTRTVAFCKPHDEIAARTGRFTLRDHPDALDTP